MNHYLANLCNPRTNASFQYHGQRLVIGLDGNGQGFALIESLFCDLETDNNGSPLYGPGEQLGLR